MENRQQFYLSIRGSLGGWEEWLWHFQSILFLFRPYVLVYWMDYLILARSWFYLIALSKIKELNAIFF